MGTAALLHECKKALESTSFDYNHLLAASVVDVWRGLTTYVERQMMLEKGVVIPVFGKFTFLKGKDAIPTFAFSDKFLKSYPRVTAKRPLAALTWHCADVNYTTVAVDAGIMKDQAQHTVEAIFKFIGEVAQGGARSCRVGFGAVGAILLEGKCMTFRYDPAFLHALQTNNKRSNVDTCASSTPVKTGQSQLERLEAMAGLRPAAQGKSSTSTTSTTIAPKKGQSPPVLALQNNFITSPSSLTIQETAAPMPSSTPLKQHDERRRRSKKSSPSPQLMKCASDNVLGASLSGVATNQHATTPPSILPRFLIPEQRRALATTQLQEVILEKAYERHEAALQDNKLRTEMLDRQYEERTRAIEIRHLKHRAVAALQQRDMHDHLKHQTLEKQLKKLDEEHKLAPAQGPVTILPQAKVWSKDEKKAQKAVLRAQLDTELQKKDRRKEMARDVQRDEEVYFMACVQKQHQVEREAVARQKQLDKEALMKEWSRQTKTT
ncbi:Aste57867_19026 [Aphanomyces stellatus]|uniref:Aste57867_19026 protein n=1 Tax=Aphanomyces stellatus TaxID=120398 RepID=A0A485LC74_9STRA|nr:hypothetical protein As57867_018962 [Aphanomyces stellatus]VFT95751.1 Aste57867_19026 [Aphanomyces stellatus]